MKPEARTDDLYLTKEQVNTTLDGLNMLMADHYGNYENDLPQDLIDIINILIEARNKFKYCPNCRSYYYQRWSSYVCTDCPEEEE